ncbi:NAD-dependent epimerase/dehydratase family protein [Phytoactinopolyspora halotolerans]|uniref:NAD(P)-dependent oxidoreductase n=1 Tax=Phytoactinopolyspora halotolerans TaxID=1981512 RepID=A0A6L9SGA2_9ACTN|nr:NAD(P)-dependent oxidoreductase [Phytoactinopolyspora halotolerans]NEE04395.1 NAD(P)-dependent oxidoreductase [Phytoactinopolyspora halotolerans]
MSGEPVLVTGAAGRLGSAVVRRLHGHGRPVLATDRAPRPPDVPEAVPWRPSELGDPATVAALIAGGDVGAVIHLAAIPGPQWHPAHTVFTANTAATFAVLAAAAEAAVRRVVVASSCSAYGFFWARHDRSPLYAPIDEEHPLLAEDPYALSKQTDEAIAAMFHRSHALAVALLRLPAVTTPEYLAQLAAEIAADPAEGARGLWSYLHVDDAAEAFVAALDAPGIGLEACNVAAVDSLSDIPTEELLRAYHPTTQIRRSIGGMDSVWDISKAARVLRWRPQHSWRDDDHG